MANWKSDPLYRQILGEALALWGELDPDDRPELLRIEERKGTTWDDLDPSGLILDVWLLDDSGIRLVPILRREEHDFGSARGAFSRFGLVRFAIGPDSSQVGLEYRLGPAIGGEIIYEVEGEGDGLRLEARTGTLSR